MDTILKYLENPMQIGVYNYLSIIDFSSLFDYLDELIDKFKNLRDKDKAIKVSKIITDQPLEKLEEAKKQLVETGVPELIYSMRSRHFEESFFEKLINTLSIFSEISDECPEKMRDLFTRKIGGSIRIKRMSKLFDSRIIPSINDVIVMEKRFLGSSKWLFEITTVTEDGLSYFKSKLESIPPIKKKLEVKKQKQHFSTRYVFKPYPWAVRLWLEKPVSITIPQDLKSFLSGAIRYIFSSEWRTSIVLSAITIESVLADIYEEKYKKPAPDTPLGDLFKKVSNKVTFPSEVKRAVKMTNDARIAAVHRSRFAVSDKESNNALFGAINFVLWYYS